MAVTHQRVSVGTTATQLTSDADGRDGQTISIQVPASGATVYLGGAGVTTASYGYELLEGTSFCCRTTTRRASFWRCSIQHTDCECI
jgi:hypothetical protein